MSAEAQVLGLDLRRDDGSSATLEFRSGELVDLIDLQDGDPLRLFTDEERPVGRYTGARLLLDEAGADYDVPAVDDDLTFRNVTNVQVDAGEVLQRDLD